MTDQTTEAAAVAEIIAAQTTVAVDLSEFVESPHVVALHKDMEVRVLDGHHLRDRPRRPKGRIPVTTSESFVTAVGQRQLADHQPVLYADEQSMRLVCILNDDGQAGPGWRDYTIEFWPSTTPEWARWIEADDEYLDQDAFADLIERGLKEIVDPVATEMLELAQTFQATTAARFKSGAVGRTGARTIAWEEEIEATGGKEGQIDIPAEFTLALRPFYGSIDQDFEGAWVPSRFRLKASLRFRLREGKLAIGYRLDEPHEVKRHAWRRVCEHIVSETGATLIYGPPPAAALAADDVSER